jgi:hypothetical protein
MNIPCPNPCVVCEPSIGRGIGPLDPSNPFVNLSSEDQDFDEFIGRRYVVGQPPIGSTWFKLGCIGLCISDVSQQEADLCALAQATVCQAVNWPQVFPNSQNQNNPFTEEPRELFGNQAQFCSFSCPDGTPFTFTVAAGLFLNYSQLAANIEAFTFACNQAVNNRVCLGSLSPARTCSGSLYNGTMVCSSASIPITFTIIGEIPDGLLLSQNNTTAFFDGTPTTPGDYVWTVVATDPAGNTMQKVVNLTVFGVATVALPEAELGVAYSSTLTHGGTAAGTVSWSIAAGVLPDGLLLDTATGIISGTPTTAETQSFTVQVTDGALTCFRQLSIEVVDNTCPDWNDLLWNNSVIFTDGTGVGSFNPQGSSNATFTLALFADGTLNSVAETQTTPEGTISYNGPGCNAVLDLNYQDTNPGGVANVVVTSALSGLLLQLTPAPVGINSNPIVIPDTLGMTDTISVFIQGQKRFDVVDGTMSMQGTFSNA